MKIAILGTGEVGQALAPAFLSLGHEVSAGTRDPRITVEKNHTFRETLARHPDLELAQFAHAIKGSHLVVNALAGPMCVDALIRLAGNIGPRIVMDISSPFDGKADEAVLNPVNTDSLGEQVQRALPTARVVKTLNTMAAVVMTDPGAVGTRDHSVFISGNSPQAKDVVTDLLTAIGWTDVIDLGSIRTARASEMLLRMWIDLYKALDTDRFGFKVVRPSR